MVSAVLYTTQIQTCISIINILYTNPIYVYTVYIEVYRQEETIILFYYFLVVVVVVYRRAWVFFSSFVRSVISLVFFFLSFGFFFARVTKAHGTSCHYKFIRCGFPRALSERPPCIINRFTHNTRLDLLLFFFF